MKFPKLLTTPVVWIGAYCTYSIHSKANFIGRLLIIITILSKTCSNGALGNIFYNGKIKPVWCPKISWQFYRPILYGRNGILSSPCLSIINSAVCITQVKSNWQQKMCVQLNNLKGLNNFSDHLTFCVFSFTLVFYLQCLPLSYSGA